MIEVILTTGERMTAALAGGMRQMCNTVARRPDAHGHQGDGYLTHVQGIQAEIAVARATNTYFDPFAIQRPDRGLDVGDLHVRSTARENGCLILHDSDPEGRYVLVTVAAPRCLIIGYFDKPAEMDRRYWRDDPGVRNPAHFISQHALKDPKGMRFDLTPAESRRLDDLFSDGVPF